MPEQFDTITKVRALCLLACAKQMKKFMGQVDESMAGKVSETIEAEFKNIVTENMVDHKDLVLCTARMMAKEIDREIHLMMAIVAEVEKDGTERKNLLMRGIKHVCTEILGHEVEL